MIKLVLFTFVVAFMPLQQVAMAATYTNFPAPRNAYDRMGDSSANPLNTGGPERFQQVYASTLFADFPQGVSIAGMVFRGDENLGHPFLTTISDVEVHLSTTSQAVDSLSPVFDLNVGGDDQIVIGRSPFRLMGASDFDPRFWTVFLDFTANPFLYNPAAGNLLLDIKVFSGATTESFDAFTSASDELSSVFGFGTSIPSSGQATSLGLATDFVAQSVPEPSSMALLVFGAVVMALTARRKIQR